MESTVKGISEFVIQVYDDDREALLAHARDRGFGVEVADFYHPKTLDDAARCRELIVWYRERLPSVRGTVAFHGAFLDLHPYSPDPKAVALAEERITHCLDLAEELGVRYVVFHSDLNSQIRGPEYPSRWKDGQAKFWRRVMQGRSATLLLENLWNPAPELLAEAVDAIGQESVGVCFDTGHAHLRGETPLSHWVEVLGPRLRYLHLSDNDRSWDQHLPPGGGTVDWADLLSALDRQGLRVPAVMEVLGGVEAARAGSEYLSSLTREEERA